MDDSFITITGGFMIVLAVFAGWSTVQYELNTIMQWRIAKYVTNVLTLMLGFALGQFVAIKIAAGYGIGSDNMLVVLPGFIAGSFVAMWLIQAVEYAFRRSRGLEALPYRLVRFDLFRW